MFKTTNIGSFIRQLNLYGFRKLNVVRFAETTPDMREVHEFQNDFFHRGRPDLLGYLKRNVGIRRTRDLAVKRRLETIESGSAAKYPRYAPQVLLSVENNTIGESRAARDAPLAKISSFSCSFRGKNWSNSRIPPYGLALSPPGNPGSASECRLFPVMPCSHIPTPNFRALRFNLAH